MNSPLFYLLTRSLANGLRTRIARLRKPKYAIGALFGAAYFYLYFYRFLFRGDFQHRPPRGETPIDLGLSSGLAIPAAAFALLLILIAVAWLFPASRASLAMTEAEVAWLMPGPVTRAQLIRYKVLKSQLGLLIVAILMTFLTGRMAGDGNGWFHAFGWWVVFATIQLHRLGASFVLTRLMERGMSNWVRRLLVLAVAGGFIGVLVAWAREVPEAPGLRDAVMNGQFGPWLAAAVNVGPARWVLAPFSLVVAPWFAQDTLEFFRAMGAALLVLAAHYWWVIRSDVAFEEASVHRSEKIAKILAARRSGDWRVSPGAKRRVSEPLFRLAPMGWVLPAFIWKSFLQAGGRARARLLVGIGTVVVVVAASVEGELSEALSAMVGTIVMMLTLFAAPQLTAQAVRQELAAADFFKVAPVRGWQVVLGQVLGPAIRWSALQFAAVAVVILGTAKLPAVFSGELPHMLTLLACAGAMLVPFNVTSTLIPCGMMLLFPGWWKPGEMRGVEASGMGIVMVFVQVIALGLSLLIPLASGLGVFLVVNWLAGVDIALLAGAAVAAGTLAVEGWVGTLVLGAIYERYDSSEER